MLSKSGTGNMQPQTEVLIWPRVPAARHRCAREQMTGSDFPGDEYRRISSCAERHGRQQLQDVTQLCYAPCGMIRPGGLHWFIVRPSTALHACSSYAFITNTDASPSIEESSTQQVVVPMVDLGDVLRR